MNLWNCWPDGSCYPTGTNIAIGLLAAAFVAVLVALASSPQ